MEQLEQFGYKQELRRVLGLFDSFAVQFSLISVSGGILLLFKWGLTTSGPAFLWAWVLGGILQLSVGLSIAEIASAYPLAGSCYNWIRHLHGHFLSWITGYSLIVAHISAIAFVDYAVAPYFLNFAGIVRPTGAQIAGVALACLCGQTVINLLSIRISTTVNSVRVLSEIMGLSVLIIALLIAGLRHGPSLLFNATGTAEHEHMPPFLLVLLGPASIISSFDSTTNVSEEMKNPAHNVPRGAMIANLVAFTYGTALIAVALLATTDLATTTNAPLPLLYVMQARLGSTVATIFEILMIATLCLASLMMQLTVARVVWAQARDGALPAARWLHTLNKRQSPANATILCAIIIGLFWLAPQALVILTAVGALAWAAAYGITVAVSLRAKLQRRMPERRGWNLGRWGIVNDTMALLWSGVLIVLLPLTDIVHTLIGIGLSTAIGLLVYAIGVKPHWTAGKPPMPAKEKISSK